MNHRLNFGEHRRPPASPFVLETKCNCGGLCAEADNVKALTDYAHKKKERLQQALRFKVDVGNRRRQVKSTPEINRECIRLQQEWDLTKDAIKRAINKLERAARKMETIRRSISSEMDGDIALAFGMAVTGLIGAAIKLDPIAATEALASFESWRRRYNRDLPGKIVRRLVGAQANYESAYEWWKAELENEKKITSRMAALRCANFS